MNNKIALIIFCSLLHQSTTLLGGEGGGFFGSFFGITSSTKRPPAPLPQPQQKQKKSDLQLLELQKQQELEKKEREREQQELERKKQEKQNSFDSLLQQQKEKEDRLSTLRTSSNSQLSTPKPEQSKNIFDKDIVPTPPKKTVSAEEFSADVQDILRERELLKEQETQQLLEEKLSEDRKRRRLSTEIDVQKTFERFGIKKQSPKTTPITPASEPYIDPYQIKTRFQIFNQRTLFKWSAFITSAIALIAAYNIWKDRIIELGNSFIFGTPDHIEP